MDTVTGASVGTKQDFLLLKKKGSSIKFFQQIGKVLICHAEHDNSK